VRSCDCGASRADEFWGGTSAGGVTGDVTGDVTGSELAEVCQQIHMSVMGRNTLPVNSASLSLSGSGAVLLLLASASFTLFTLYWPLVHPEEAWFWHSFLCSLRYAMV